MSQREIIRTHEITHTRTDTNRMHAHIIIIMNIKKHKLVNFISIPILNNLFNIKQCYKSQTSTDYLNYKVETKAC